MIHIDWAILESVVACQAKYLKCHKSSLTSSMYSFSQARCNSVRTSKIAKTRTGSHIRDGKDVMSRFRYFDAISLALAIRWVLATRRPSNSADR